LRQCIPADAAQAPAQFVQGHFTAGGESDEGQSHVIQKAQGLQIVAFEELENVGAGDDARQQITGNQRQLKMRRQPPYLRGG